MKYVSDNGKVFDNEQECLAYENAIKKKKEEREKLEAEKDARLKELLDSYNVLVSKISSFERDYCNGQASKVSMLMNLPFLHITNLK